jgi:hypothetical protein
MGAGVGGKSSHAKEHSRFKVGLGIFDIMSPKLFPQGSAG